VIELERIYGILSSFLGESKQGGYDNDTTQYQFNCPYCADEKGYTDGKYNLEVSLEILKFHCWADDMSGSLSKIIKKYGGRNLLKEYYDLVKSLKSNELYKFTETLEKVKDKEPLKLPKTYRKINLKTCTDRYVLNYLKKRNIDQWTINRFKIGYTTWDEEDKSWANRLIIPSYDSAGNLNYFVGRDYMPQKPDSTFKRIKYKNCDADKKEIVFQESEINTDADITVVEGALDCIYGPNTASLLGKFLTKESELFKFLTERANAKVIICLDNDTKEEETLKICRLLNETRLTGRIWYIQMDEYKDFGEAFEKDGVKGITKVLRSAKKYDFDHDI
jgi:DNA primase